VQAFALFLKSKPPILNLFPKKALQGREAVLILRDNEKLNIAREYA